MSSWRHPRVIALALVLFVGASLSATAAEGDDGETRSQLVAALERYVVAQVRGDAEALLMATAADEAPPQARRRAHDLVERFLGAFRVESAKLTPLAAAIAPAGCVAVLRFAYSARVRDAGGVADHAGGAVASLLRRGDSWVVGGITIDEPLTMDVFESVSTSQAGAEPLAAARPVSPGSRYAELDELARALEKVSLNWHIDDEDAVMDQAMSLTGLGVTGFGDLVSSGYTLYERMQTLLMDLPGDIRRGNIGASLLDIALVGWGVVQVTAEVIPGADSATDQMEMLLEAGRYNFVQREGYLKLRRELERRSFQGLPRVLALRWLASSLPEQVVAVPVPGWIGKPIGLSRLAFLGDAMHRREDRLIFDCFVQLPIPQKESEDLFTMARMLGMPLDTTQPPSNAVVLLKVRLTPLVDEVEPVPATDRVLTDWRLGQGPRRRITARLGARPGIQNVVLRLGDGTRTERCVVENRVYNTLSGVALHTSGDVAISTVAIPMGASTESLRLMGVTEPGTSGTIASPDLTGLPWAHVTSADPDICSVRMEGSWPQARLCLDGSAPGNTSLHVKLDGDGDTVPTKTFSVPVTVSGEVSAGAESRLDCPEIESYGYLNPGFRGAWDHTWNDPPDVLVPGDAFDLRVSVRLEELDGALRLPTIEPITGVTVLGGRAPLENLRHGPDTEPSVLQEEGRTWGSRWWNGVGYFQVRAVAVAGGYGWSPGDERPADWIEGANEVLAEKVPGAIPGPDGTMAAGPVAGELLLISHWATLRLSNSSKNYYEVNRLYELRRDEDGTFRWHVIRRWSSTHPDGKEGSVVFRIEPMGE